MLEKKKMAQFWEGGLYFARQSYPQPTLISKNGGVYEAHDRTRCHFTFTCAAPSFTRPSYVRFPTDLFFPALFSSFSFFLLDTNNSTRERMKLQ